MRLQWRVGLLGICLACGSVMDHAKEVGFFDRAVAKDVRELREDLKACPANGDLLQRNAKPRIWISTPARLSVLTPIETVSSICGGSRAGPHFCFGHWLVFVVRGVDAATPRQRSCPFQKRALGAHELQTIMQAA